MASPLPHFDRSLPADPDPDPEDRLAELARAGPPLRRVVAALAGRLVDRQAWSRLDYARLGDYARERLGISARAVQEFARVDRALAELPRLEAALVSGRLPWSKVRLLARCATREDEARWIAHAERTGVRALERDCRAVARGAAAAEGLALDEEGGDTSPSEWVRLSAPLHLAFAWRRTVKHAETVAGERLGAAGALELVTAEVLSAVGLGAGGADGSQGVGNGTGPAEASGAIAGPEDTEGAAAASSAPGLAGHAPAAPAGETGPRVPVELPRFLAPLLEALDDADAHELDARLRRAVRLEQRLDTELAPLLRHVTASGFAWRGRHRTVAAYARERLGMSPRKARALLRLERLGDLCPVLRRACRDGALSWLQAQTLAPLLAIDAGGGAWREAWVAWAGTVTLRRLEEAVDAALTLRLSAPGAWHARAADPERIVRAPAACSESAATERQECARATAWSPEVRVRVRAPRELARLFRAVLCRVRLALERQSGRLPSEAEGFAAMLAHALASWGVDDRRLRRQLRRRHPVFERDGWRCTVPGCTSRRNLQAHHIRFRSQGGPDTEANQTTLCAFHHQRGVHGGTLRITGTAPHALRFALGTRAGRPPLVRYRSGDVLIPSATRHRYQEATLR